MLRVDSALIWPAFEMPTTMPNCCCAPGSDCVAAIRPYSMGLPAY
jgi:hypothetical protein